MAEAANEPKEGFYRDDESQADDAQVANTQAQSVTWTASEFIAHDKSASWYLLLTGGTLLLAALVFLVTKDKVSVAVIIVAGLMLGIYASHKPRQLEYKLDQNGLSIGNKRHFFNEFRSFSVVPEGAFAGIIFMPLRRFAVPLTIYYAPDDEEKIMAIVSPHLPFEEHRADPIDSLMRRIRF